MYFYYSNRPQPVAEEPPRTNYGIALRRVLLGDLRPFVLADEPKTVYADRTLDAPNLSGDADSSNLLDWGKTDVLSIVLGDDVHFFHVPSGKHDEITFDDVSSLRWAPDGQRVALGFNGGEVIVHDFLSKKALASFSANAAVSSLSWKSHNLLSVGGADGTIDHFDVRASGAVGTYRGHRREVCGLSWSESGRQLASGGRDGVVNIWDVSVLKTTTASASRWNATTCLHRFAGNEGGVRALAWCPWKTDLLAAGDSAEIKFFNTGIGNPLTSSSLKVASRVNALLWDKRDELILSAVGNTMALYKYPSMDQTANLIGHKGLILHTAQSPDGCTLASGSGQAPNETLQFWKEIPMNRSANEHCCFVSLTLL